MTNKTTAGDLRASGYIIDPSVPDEAQATLKPNVTAEDLRGRIQMQPMTPEDYVNSTMRVTVDLTGLLDFQWVTVNIQMHAEQEEADDE